MSTKLQYFSEDSANRILDEYKNLIGIDFYFEESKQIKKTLIDISIGNSITPNGFHVNFIFDGEICPIYKFMKLNDSIDYDFTKYQLIDFVA